MVVLARVARLDARQPDCMARCAVLLDVRSMRKEVGMSTVTVDILLALLCILVVLIGSALSALFVVVDRLGKASETHRVLIDKSMRSLSRIEAAIELSAEDEPTSRWERPSGNGE